MKKVLLLINNTKNSSGSRMGAIIRAACTVPKRPRSSGRVRRLRWQSAVGHPGKVRRRPHPGQISRQTPRRIRRLGRSRERCAKL